jgi:drug/metabolite transporter (DMT)-like permease
MTPAKPQSNLLPWVAFVAISLIWGSTWLAHKWALADFSPMGLGTLRFVIAGGACLLMGRLFKEQWPAATELPVLLLTGLMLTGVANVVTAWTLLHIPSGIGAVLQSPIPIWLALFAWSSDPLSRRGWCAVALGFAGVMLVVWPEGKHSVPMMPALICASTAALWAYASMQQRARVKSGGLYTNVGLCMLTSSLFGMVLTPFMGGYVVSAELSWQAMLAAAYLVVFGSVIAYASYIYLTRVWHPARAGSFSYLNPIVAVLLGFYLGGERMNARMVLGMAVILVSVWVLNQATRKPASTPSAVESEAVHS